jgi:hypothetical protein
MTASAMEMITVCSTAMQTYVNVSILPPLIGQSMPFVYEASGYALPINKKLGSHWRRVVQMQVHRIRLKSRRSGFESCQGITK